MIYIQTLKKHQDIGHRSLWLVSSRLLSDINF